MNDFNTTSDSQHQIQQTVPVRSRTRLRRLSLAVFVLLAVMISWRAGRDRGFFGGGDSLLPQAAAQVRSSVPQFDLRKARIPKNEIRHGGPPKDGIPALSKPNFVNARQATYLQPDDRVIGVTVGEQFRAYPLRILSYHEIVNDRLGEVPIAVTYCPLCDSAVVFDRRTPLGEREFGVSGLLYNSNVLLYDRGGNPESLWSQIMATGVSGAGVDQPLHTLPLELTTWDSWSRRHPSTLVLSKQTGHARDYRHSPYRWYFQTNVLLFPVNRSDDRLPVKAPVLGVWTDHGSKAYPLSSFSKSSTRIDDHLAGLALTVEYSPESNSLRVANADEGIQWMYSLWFAWSAFHPDTDIYLPSSP